MRTRISRHAITLAGLSIFAITQPAVAYTSASKFLDQPLEWYRSPEAAKMATSILSFQTSTGGWPKNTETAGEVFAGDPTTLHATFDNGGTSMELRYLAKMATATKEKKYEDAFMRGLDYVLKSQYPNGGWPQSSPPGEGYARYITYNDGAMIRLMFFVRDVAKDDTTYAFVPSEERKAASAAWDKGLDCILKTQIRVDGKLTAWCAQHDEKDLSPRPARAFELASISGCETIGIVHALMAVENPSPEIVASVDAAAAWLESVKIPGIKVEDRPQEGTPKGIERFVVKDPSAPPMWARFYEIGTNRPIFADRTSVKKYDLSEIDIERRTGYQWIKYWPKNFLEKEYPAWKAKLATRPAE
jgi:PelA/Pel-15E family pectate lyase